MAERFGLTPSTPLPDKTDQKTKRWSARLKTVLWPSPSRQRLRNLRISQPRFQSSTASIYDINYGPSSDPSTASQNNLRHENDDYSALIALERRSQQRAASGGNLAWADNLKGDNLAGFSETNDETSSGSTSMSSFLANGRLRYSRFMALEERLAQIEKELAAERHKVANLTRKLKNQAYTVNQSAKGENHSHSGENSVGDFVDEQCEKSLLSQRLYSKHEQQKNMIRILNETLEGYRVALRKLKFLRDLEDIDRYDALPNLPQQNLLAQPSLSQRVGRGVASHKAAKIRGLPSILPVRSVNSMEGL